MEKPKRKHVATGKKPPGGKRPGAGRPPGTPNVLRYGEVKAVKAIRWRVPEGTAPEAAEAADRAFSRIIDVMDGRVHYVQASSVLKAATTVREEVCGPVTKKHEVQGSVSIAIVNPYAEGEGADG